MLTSFQHAAEDAQFRLPHAAEIGFVERFTGQWQVRPLLPANRLSQLAKRGRIESVRAALAFGGTEISAEAIRAILAGGGVPSVSDERVGMVVGIAAALETVTELRQDLAPDSEFVLGLHRTLFAADRRAKPQAGKFRTNMQFSESFINVPICDLIGQVQPRDIPSTLDDMFEWAEGRFLDISCSPIYVASTIFLRFLMIAPFRDGNAIMALLLMRLMLLRGGYSFIMYCSVKSILAQAPKIRNASDGAKIEGDRMWPDWSEAADRLATDLAVNVDQLKNLAGSEPTADEQLADLSERIVNLFRLHRRLSIAQIVTHTAANRNTVKVHVRQLVTRGLLLRRGAGRGASYIRA